jgi:hypothetical protein
MAILTHLDLFIQRPDGLTGQVQEKSLEWTAEIITLTQQRIAHSRRCHAIKKGGDCVRWESIYLLYVVAF